ncbi:MAG TPA: two-component regulator propeller domain-containing protein [Fimbriimonadaceae bacterium]|nr:two-component regulator propeller domain-containing protein [Fimbriimonadaceae bacterium]HRJ95354.1 two-component regulator propeller domain-containing protein [Fimbriimonadaceae bacterium]
MPPVLAVDCKAPPKLGAPVTAFASNLRTIYQDRNGHYWIGSDHEGLYRYDGKTLLRYTKQDGLPSDQVVEIQEDKKGNLYFTTYAGISRFDGKAFTTLTPVVMDAPDKGWRLHKDDLWFVYGSKDGGPSRYDGKSLYCLRFPKHHLEEAKLALKPASSMYAIYTIYKDRKGYLWFGTADAGLCRYDGRTINWLYEDHLTNVPGGGSFGIRSIIEDREGKLWVCNTRNRYLVSPRNLPAHGLIHYKSEVGIGSLKSVIGGEWLYFQSVVKGKEGDLWMMPWGGGIFRYNGKRMTRYPVKDGDKDAYMSQIYKDRRGDLWIASQTGGPYKFNGKSFERFLPKGVQGLRPLWPD